MEEQDLCNASDELQSERWIPIEGLPPYEASSMGRLKGFRGRILDPKPNARGYTQAALSQNGQQINRLVHVLVARAFVPNPAGKPFVNHINGRRSDNRATNLEWVTASENSARKTVKTSPATRAVRQLSLEGEMVQVWSSAVAASEALGFQRGSISACCRGDLGQHHGFLWEYAEDILEGEIWTTVTHKERSYEVSSLGRVGVRGGKKTYGSRTGNYMIITGGAYVHRLVALAFCPNPLQKAFVNHKNGVGSDNRAANLEWVTHRENVAHAAAAGLRSRSNPKLRKPVRAVKPDGSITEYPSVSAASEATRVDFSKIAAVCRGERRSAGGIRWVYTNVPPESTTAPEHARSEVLGGAGLIPDDDPLWAELGL